MSDCKSNQVTRAGHGHTCLEGTVRPILESLGFEYRPQDIDGCPDFAHRTAKVVVFIDDCFLHMCPEHCDIPDGDDLRRDLERTRQHDRHINGILAFRQWRVLRVWEHDLERVS